MLFYCVMKVSCITLCLFLSTTVALEEGKKPDQQNNNQDDDCPSASTLSASIFEETVTKQDTFVMFFAPWCGHCKRMKPTWEELAAKINGDDQKLLLIAKVDCTQETTLCADQGVRGYPTLMYYKFDDPMDGDKYTGARTMEDLQTFIDEQRKATQDSHEMDVDDDDGLYELTSANFHSHTAVGDHFVKFYAPWCGHCKKMVPAWKELAATFDDSQSVAIGNVDCTKHNKICAEFDVKGFPTLLYLRDGKVFEKYQGERKLQALLMFVHGIITDKVEPAFNQEEGRVPPPVPEVVINEGPVVLTEKSFDDTIAKPQLTLVKFYAPWCGHCKKLAPTWDQLAKAMADVPDVVIAKVNCEDEGMVCSVQQVEGYPTLSLYQSGDRIEEYSDDRSLDSLINFINKHRGKDEL